MGHCLGANIAVQFAACYPGHSAGMVLVEPILCEALSGKLRRLRALAPLVRGVIAVIHLGNRLGLYRRHLQPLDLRTLDAELRAHLGTPGEAEFLARRYGSLLQDLRIMPSANFLQDLPEVTRPLSLSEIRAPFLALLSTGRGFVDPARTRERLVRLPQGEVETLKAEHWIPAERPLAMRQAIERWVGGRNYWRGK